MAPDGVGEDPRARGSAKGGLHTESTPGVGCSRYGARRGGRPPSAGEACSSDFAQRLVSKKTGEWMYEFKPTVGEVILYVKVILGGNCVVISFHEEEDQSDEYN